MIILLVLKIRHGIYLHFYVVVNHLNKLLNLMLEFKMMKNSFKKELMMISWACDVQL